MARVLCEFYGHCGGYIYVKLNLELNGNHVVNCPNCGHKHYRVVKNGIITEDRFNESFRLADELILMPSAYTKTKRVMGRVALQRQAEAIGSRV